VKSLSGRWVECVPLAVQFRAKRKEGKEFSPRKEGAYITNIVKSDKCLTESCTVAQ
jgi:hypothetical protein